MKIFRGTAKIDFEIMAQTEEEALDRVDILDIPKYEVKWIDVEEEEDVNKDEYLADYINDSRK